MRVEDALQQWLQDIVGYLPNLIGGLILSAIGIAGGWLAKGVVVRLASMLRLGRQLRRFHWGRDLGKADVRLALYGALGNIAWLVVFLVFLNAAFSVMNLTVLSGLAERAVLVFPRLMISLAIIGGGWLVSRRVSVAIRQWLRRERVPRPSLIAGYARAMILVLFAAMGIAELNIARPIVIIGFSVIFVVMGVLTVVLTAVGGQTFIEHLLGGPGDEGPG